MSAVGREVQAARASGDESALRERIEALIGGATPPAFLSDRPNKIVRVEHRDRRLGATVTQSMVKVDDIVAALRDSASVPTPRSPRMTDHSVTRAHTCVPHPHQHIGICQRTGYANGRADLAQQIEALHPPHVEQSGKTACTTCLVDYPCPTIRATEEDPS